MAFTGKASYDDITLIGEDVSDLIEIFAPIETPFLDRIQMGAPTRNTQHQWMEETLGPRTLVNSTAINSATADTGIRLAANGDKLTVGMTLQITGSDPINDEMVRVVSVVGASSVLVARNIAGTGVDSLAAGGTVTVIGATAEEGSETAGDITVPRVKRTNYTSIFKRPILISGTARAAGFLPGEGGDELATQTARRTIEVLQDLERAALRGAPTNSIGADDTPRMMQGLLNRIATINSTVTASSFNADPGGYLGDVWQQAYNNGARDIDLIIAGDQFKRDISGANISITRTTFDERRRSYRVDTIETDFGVVDVLLTPWLPSSWAIGVATSRLRVVPFANRTFGREDLARTGDFFRSHILGEYTLEHHNEDGMFQIHT